MFASRREANHAGILEAMRRSPDKTQKVEHIEFQFKFPIIVNGHKIATYVADFVVTFADGHREIHETKGYPTKEYLLKKKLVEALYGVKILEF